MVFSQMFEDNGNKCGKCQNHEIEISKKGHARDCPFKKCICSRCRLLDARSDILQVISGKETKLKGTKKDPNCGFCQNHGVRILRKGHVRSCEFGQERHFRLQNCFDCEVHFIRNEVNRLQIKMRRAMKEDRSLSEEQKKTTRDPISHEEVEKVCAMARMARKKRELKQAHLVANIGETSNSSPSRQLQLQSPHSNHNNSNNNKTTRATVTPAAPTIIAGTNSNSNNQVESIGINLSGHPTIKTEPQGPVVVAPAADVWRPWSQHQVAVAMAAHQQQQQLQLAVANQTFFSYINSLILGQLTNNQSCQNLSRQQAADMAQDSGSRMSNK